jgi:hypothetical protein
MTEDKNVAKDRNEEDIEAVSGDADPRKVAEDMADSICKMCDDREKKSLAAKEHLVSQLEVTAEKYCTANGVMMALGVVRDVYADEDGGDVEHEIDCAKQIAVEMSIVAEDLAKKAKSLDISDMSKLCDDEYDKEFATGDGDAHELISQVMILNLCQNVGPNAEDITGFWEQTTQEIAKAWSDLEDYCQENDLNFGSFVDTTE